MSNKLLEDIRVLDFTDFLAGPYCGMYLADLGAEVIKIENLKSGGNITRTAHPRDKNTGLAMYFQNINRNKKGVALNLKSEEGKNLFTALVKSADVLVENNRPGVMDRLGFGYEDCKKINPSLVYASVSGFGQTGPYSYRPGYDLIAQAMAASMSVTGFADTVPLRAGIAIGDILGGLNACIGIISSLYKRRETGAGNRIDVALVDSIFSAMENKIMTYVYTGKSPGKTGNRYLTAAPYDSFRAKDDYFVIASGTEQHFVELSAAFGLPQLAEDPRFLNRDKRNEHYRELKEIIEDWAKDKTVSQVCEIIDNAGIPVAPIYNVEQLCKDENITKERTMLVQVPTSEKHREVDTLTVVGNPIKMPETPIEYYKQAPDLGEDNYEIFSKLGFSKEELEQYAAKSIVNLVMTE